MTELSRSFIPARQAAPQSTVPLAPAQDSSPASVAADSPHSPVVGTRLNLRRSATADLELQRDRLQFPLAMIPCPRID